MERKEKWRIPIIFVLLGAITLISLVRFEVRYWQIEQRQSRLRIASEEKLYESAGRIHSALGALAREWEDEQLYRLYSAAAAGSACLSALSIPDVSSSQLSRYFHALSKISAASPDLSLISYSESLVSYLDKRKAEPDPDWEGLPQFTDSSAGQSETTDLPTVSERKAREVAQRSLGGNIVLRQCSAQTDGGYLYLLSNAYVFVGGDGRVERLRREPSDAGEIKVDEATKTRLARQALADCGYARGEMTIDLLDHTAEGFRVCAGCDGVKITAVLSQSGQIVSLLSEKSDQ